MSYDFHASIGVCKISMIMRLGERIRGIFVKVFDSNVKYKGLAYIHFIISETALFLFP